MADRDNKGRYEKGRKESPEQKIKRINALRDAWKSRDDYIGDINNMCPHIHTVWRGIRFTKKAKKIGCSKEWEDFRTFFNDVYPSYQEGMLFRRPDITKPYSKDNFLWVKKEDETAFKSNSIYLTYNGETLLLKDWADRFGLSLNGLRLRYHRHKEIYTVEEILFGKKVQRGSKKAKDVTDENVNVRAKASKMISAYKNKDKKMGVSICDMDIEWMVLHILTKPCIYCGDTYRIGADRIDNTEGHTKANVVPCCYECNCARNANFSFEEMRILGKTIEKIKQSRGVEKKSPESIVKNSLIVHNPSKIRWGKMKVYQYDLNWNLIRIFDSIKQAAEDTGFNTKGIGAACNGRDYKKEHKYRGYLWEHK